MNYIYKITNRGLCSELNSLIGFYESIIEEDCRVFVDGCDSQYFKDVSIHDVFSFPDNFIKEALSKARIISSNKWRKCACRNAPSIGLGLSLFSYNKSFLKEISNTIEALRLPKDYNCFHIRRGDKVGEKLYRWTNRTGKTESKKFDFKDYLYKTDSYVESVFIMTDDYKSVLEAKEYIGTNNLRHKVLTLADETQAGHSTDLDTDGNRHYSREELVRFFTEIEIAKQSSCFVGTESSNIYRFIENTLSGKKELKTLD